MPAVVGGVLLNVYFALRAAGRSSRQAVAAERELLVPWLESRLAAGHSRSMGDARGKR